MIANDATGTGSRGNYSDGVIRATATADKMQSAADRIASHLTQMVARGHSLPYEVLMAKFELQAAISEWTEIRKKWAP